MFSKRIFLRIVLGVIGILAFSGTGICLIASKKAVIIGFFCLAGGLFLIERLIAYLNRSNRQILRFLEALQDNDSMNIFPENSLNKEQRLLYAAFNHINDRITQSKIDNRQQEYFYKALLEQIPNGIISWDESGEIRIINHAALRLLELDTPRYIYQLERTVPNLSQIIKNASINGTSLLRIIRKEQISQLAVSYKHIVQNDEHISILTLKDIGRELSEKEIESWDKLTHVLTHEIMNSIAPIVSLSGTILSYFEQKGNPKPMEEITGQTIQKAIRGLKTVKNQGQGLMRFTDSYRRLSYLQPPVIKPFSLNHLCDNLQLLLQSDLVQKGITLTVSLPPEEITLEADKEMLSQVLLNLIKNAMQALEETEAGHIRLEACQSPIKTQIDIIDNGPGIAKDLMEDIFVPFFTTKSTGSGIGLSLSRQIIRMHGGELHALSEPYQQTRFTLTLPSSNTTSRIS